MNEFQEKISNLLDKKGAISPCNRCGNDELSIVSSDFSVPDLQAGGWTSGSIRCAVLCCKKCGALIFHSLKELEKE